MFSFIRACTLLLACGATPAAAVPVEFTFDGQFSTPGSNTPSVPVGEFYTLSVIMDNGGTDLISQDWDRNDFVSAQLTAGAYVATFAGASSPTQFHTDATGALLNPIRFASTDAAFANTDNAGGSFSPLFFFVAQVTTSEDFTFNPAGNSSTTTLSRWSVDLLDQPPAVPLPAAGWMLLAGLGALSLHRRRACA
ncbi:VPLPA-CTERM sorting domain-containing protein [Jannaschia sp. CCS1]|uniref:VPLPA-CTERM sorting domain-containing protein n=1 Tax=Jannaschia sp. (strain CCS1) TaxID=290400 RepID=UPI000053A10F|nr:VPLPA-CTERM sorting domain-containing protein [Jannaschia sp. CCS1]ABD54736.1 hypothetical protein Jann_1819 [Jannaschia sp. CCS1]